MMVLQIVDSFKGDIINNNKEILMEATNCIQKLQVKI